MAKVLVSIPDGLLTRLDEYAKRAGETRSGFLQRLAERELAVDDARRRKEFEALLGQPLDDGIDVVQWIKEDRERDRLR